MSRESCPFCRRDPYEYVDIGVGMEAAAVNCCELGILLFDPRYDSALPRRILALRRSHSPRKKARAARLMAQHGGY